MDMDDMEEVVDEVMKLSVNGTEYEKLADGEYDVVVLGTGLTECVISGILSVAGLKVRGGRGCLRGNEVSERESLS